MGIDYKVAMEVSNVHLGIIYVKLGIGVMFAGSGYGLAAQEKGNIALLPLTKFFSGNYISVVMKKNKILPKYKKAFINLLFDDHVI